jgi:hypothetical protein
MMATSFGEINPVPRSAIGEHTEPALWTVDRPRLSNATQPACAGKKNL